MGQQDSFWVSSLESTTFIRLLYINNKIRRVWEKNVLTFHISLASTTVLSMLYFMNKILKI